MSELEQHIKRVNEKLQQLLRRHASLQKENAKLRQDLIELKKTDEEKVNHISLLQQRIDVLKISRSTMTDEDKKALEKRIRQYLKEIDKCIIFMNE